MRKYLLILLAVGAQAATSPVTAPVNTTDHGFRAVEDRSAFSPSTGRASPFALPDGPRSEGVAMPTIAGKRIGLGEMLVEFIKPKATVRSGTNYEVLLNNRFFAARDVLRLEMTANAGNYEYPLVELTINAVGADYLDLYYRPNQSSNRITFKMLPELVNEEARSNLKKASLRYLGKEDKVFKKGSEYSEQLQGNKAN